MRMITLLLANDMKFQTCQLLEHGLLHINRILPFIDQVGNI